MKTLRYDTEMEWFTSQTTIGEHSVELYIMGEPEDRDHAKARADKALSWVIDQLPAILQYSADILLDVKNEGWLNEGERPVDAEAFKTHLHLLSVQVEEDGSMQLTFEDNDLFWGHWVVIEVDDAHNLVDANIEG